MFVLSAYSQICDLTRNAVDHVGYAYSFINSGSEMLLNMPRSCGMNLLASARHLLLLGRGMI